MSLVLSKRRLSGDIHPMLAAITLGKPKRTYDILDVGLDCGHYIAFDYSTAERRRRLKDLKEWHCNCHGGSYE